MAVISIQVVVFLNSIPSILSRKKKISFFCVKILLRVKDNHEKFHLNALQICPDQKAWVIIFF